LKHTALDRLQVRLNVILFILLLQACRVNHDSSSSSSRNKYYLGGIIALLLQDHRTMSAKSVCSSHGDRDHGNCMKYARKISIVVNKTVHFSSNNVL